ncbi:hypothetical protein [Candidatus Methylacidithermus pantelleriae]|uniref:Uncharacterized protein n=1 Tax=Candidatus Methylacidithermus pantelleriae TaxID=2744239 RepID=A0A8J2FND1_9BACT|nr:hypothetical protein [Candidatus Methylacidithermus pantelleriae]CAF0691501.1 hypothetical protein MPNT_100067 [Candidatus Methylacidithermus pantelleriae]
MTIWHKRTRHGISWEPLRFSREKVRDRWSVFVRKQWAWALYATILACCLYLGKGDVGFNPADEGFLWYGVVHTAGGEFPGRDFQAYDPGRYHWPFLG